MKLIQRKPAAHTYVVELTEHEASLLRGILWFCVCGTKNGLRGTADDIQLALGDAGAGRYNLGSVTERLDLPRSAEYDIGPRP